MKTSKQNKKALHIKVGDKVNIISGKNKGKIGIIKSVFKESSKVIIKEVNIKTKHIKRSQPNEPGHIQQLECPIHSSNISLYQE